jgi:signal-transduction protein with cAMP-binding, CBS, and nucleotidyltransferase domain
MKEKSNPLDSAAVLKLLNTCEVFTFNNDFILVYENQIPTTGIALLEGAIELTKETKVLVTVKEPHILGIYNLLNERPFQYGCRVKANSKIILLGKSMVLENLKNKKSELFSFLKNYA